MPRSRATAVGGLRMRTGQGRAMAELPTRWPVCAWTRLSRSLRPLLRAAGWGLLAENPRTVAVVTFAADSRVVAPRVHQVAGGRWATRACPAVMSLVEPTRKALWLCEFCRSGSSGKPRQPAAGAKNTCNLCDLNNRRGRRPKRARPAPCYRGAAPSRAPARAGHTLATRASTCLPSALLSWNAKLRGKVLVRTGLLAKAPAPFACCCRQAVGVRGHLFVSGFLGLWESRASTGPVRGVGACMPHTDRLG
jgi:hypothetical protein